MSKPTKSKFVAHVYADDYRQIQELVQQYPNIETGGDLFGLWKDKSTVVIQQFIGPGKNCKRTKTSFHQDIQYLGTVGSLITTEEGLCNVGEWHSHHQIGMPQPSAADRRTVFGNMPQLGLERFVLFIATIEKKRLSGKKRPHDVKLNIELHPFLFLQSEDNVVKGKIEIIPGKNPHRIDSRARKAIDDGAEEVWSEEQDNGKKRTTSSEKNHGKTSQKPENKKNGKMELDNTLTTGTEKKDETKAHRQLPVFRKETTRQQQEKQPQPRRETKPALQMCETELQSERRSRTSQDGQQRTRQEYVTGKNHDRKGIQGQRKENQSPNADSAALRGPEFRSPRSSSPPQRNASQQSSVAQPHGSGTQGTSLWQVWNDSSPTGTAQGHGRGIQKTDRSGNVPIDYICAKGQF